ncbi:MULTISPECIES: phosphoglycerate dehydrogenase [Reichenbachiella]|uniref:D-3-phosphoglycerate dehydrogenase n=1 Tax=Reichenbachiella agariperforans TaxID=156994 RepID=A0A1M6J6F3_REIAG|nr:MULTISPECIES: phosphoglycerate dehydrogenase [Reichenbachiella]MBU2913080.1 phosphoglycerate dehydrogenase [Reichenbachiella agariperforans]RJE74915.1 3-phosphoglycerate dehydrogenase [Reichenbachiella sp. MSK19-1]SHJ42276.1 D-3-phosphoglycerate dehydrogenase [Reichenbachiella agariperforans]
MTESKVKNFVIDFDSTFTRVEALDVLCTLAFENEAEKKVALAEIERITNLAMGGDLSFRESLESRLKILRANKNHIPLLIDKLKALVSKSFIRNKAFLESNADRVYILSNGFKEFISPIVKEYGIKEDHVYANTFEFDENGTITGFDKDNILSRSKGKPALIDSLNLEGDIYVIGDGYNDYEIRKEGKANRFYAFTENVKRQNVMDYADHIAPSLDEILYHNNMEGALSYPKNRIKILLLENIHSKGVKIVEEEGYQVEVHPAGLTEDELVEKIKDVSILGIRSKTIVTKRVLDNAKRLMSIGAFCIGTNQIDLTECTKRGITVFNAPYSNTRSVVELAIGEMIMLIRNLPDKIAKMHVGKWDKSASNSFEVRNKKLGIVGYGNIGKQLSVLAEAMGLQVYYYDIDERLPIGNVTKCNSLNEMLSQVDIVSLHVDGRKSNKNIIGKEQFDAMKDGIIFMNLSRGHVVDIPELKKAIESGKIAGTAIDVFPEEPLSNNHEFVSELRGLPNVILTPHIGGSTLEAQENIAEFVPNKIISYINSGSTTNSVNFPNLTLPKLENAHRFIHVHHNKPGIIAEINNILAKHDINVMGQYLKTNEIMGYVITDIDKKYDKDVIKIMKKIEGTIRFRVLY